MSSKTDLNKQLYKSQVNITYLIFVLFVKSVVLKNSIKNDKLKVIGTKLHDLEMMQGRHHNIRSFTFTSITTSCKKYKVFLVVECSVFSNSVLYNLITEAVDGMIFNILGLLNESHPRFFKR